MSATASVKRTLVVVLALNAVVTMSKIVVGIHTGALGGPRHVAAVAGEHTVDVALLELLDDLLAGVTQRQFQGLLDDPRKVVAGGLDLGFELGRRVRTRCERQARELAEREVPRHRVSELAHVARPGVVLPAKQ